MPLETPGSSPDQFDGDNLEVAQSPDVAQSSPSGSEAIGQVSALQGSVTITHPDGSKSQATDGAPIFQGDIIETGGNGAVGITFSDDSSFSLADNGTMVIDEMVYDSSAHTGHSALSVAEGVFTFVSGQIAKTSVDAMTITTPVAVIGIRGTSGGGQAGPEGTANTYSLFAEDGFTGEMNITTQGGSQILNTANQTTQITSAFVPPTKPVVMPAAAMKQFYSKAAAVAPKAIITDPKDAAPQNNPQNTQEQQGDQQAGQPQDAGQALDAPPADTALADQAADGGPVVDGPPQDGPLGPPPEGAEEADLAAKAAFEKVLAEGGDMNAAMNAAQEAAVETTLKGALAIDPNHFGTTGNDIMNRIVDDVLLNVTGAIDPLAAGTGAGAGFSNFSKAVFFETALNVIEDGLGDVIGGNLGDFINGPIEGPGFFEQFFDDPFQNFSQEFFFADPAFRGDGFFFDAPPPFFIADDGLLNLGGDDENKEPLTNVFDDVINGSSGNDNLFGGEGNTRFVMDQGAGTLGGIDVFNGGNGQDEVALRGLSDMQLIFNEGTLVANYDNSLTGGSSIDGTITLNNVEQLFADDGSVARVRLPFDTVGGSGFGYILSGTSGGDTLTLVNGTTLGNANLSGVTGKTVTTGQIIGSIIFGGGGNDTITGSEAGDVIFGGADSDTIRVAYAAGNNILNGGGAGTNSDTLDYTLASFTTDAKANNFSITAPKIESLRSGSGSDTATGFETLAGSNLGDTYNLTGDLSGSTLTTITGGSGNDIFNVGTGANVTQAITGGAGTNALAFTNGGTVTSISGISTINASAGTDNVTLSAASTITVNNSLESLTGSSGDDNITFTSAQNGSTIDLGAGTGDTITLAAGTNVLTLTNVESVNGSSSADTITITSTTPTTISGLAGNDILTGGSANDTIVGGAGADTLNGGSGSDIYSYTATTDGSTTPGSGDTIATANFVSGTDSFNFATAAFGDAGLTGTVGITSIAFNSTEGATLTDLTTAAAADQEAFFVELTGSTFNSTLIDAIDTALANGTAATGKGFIITDNGSDTKIFYDSDFATAGSGTLVEIATISGLADGGTIVSDQDLSIV